MNDRCPVEVIFANKTKLIANQPILELQEIMLNSCKTIIEAQKVHVFAMTALLLFS